MSAIESQFYPKELKWQSTNHLFVQSLSKIFSSFILTCKWRQKDDVRIMLIVNLGTNPNFRISKFFIQNLYLLMRLAQKCMRKVYTCGQFEKSLHMRPIRFPKVFGNLIFLTAIISVHHPSLKKQNETWKFIFNSTSSKNFICSNLGLKWIEAQTTEYIVITAKFECISSNCFSQPYQNFLWIQSMYHASMPGHMYATQFMAHKTSILPKWYRFWHANVTMYLRWLYYA